MGEMQPAARDCDLLELLLEGGGHLEPVHERHEGVDGLPLHLVRHAHLPAGPLPVSDVVPAPA